MSLWLSFQTGVQDYETFNSQLDSLARWISEPEEVLRAQDPNGSSDLSIIQDRMEQLKVRPSVPSPHVSLSALSVCMSVLLSCLVCVFWLSVFLSCLFALPVYQLVLPVSVSVSLCVCKCV